MWDTRGGGWSGTDRAASAGRARSRGPDVANVAGALAYVTIIPAILFLVLEPYNKDKFVRFHSFQCIFFNAACCVLAFALFIVSWILAFIPILGGILVVLLWLALILGMFGVWIFLVYKAYNNQRFLLPVLGKLAAQQAG